MAENMPFEKIIEALDEGLCLSDLAGKVLWANPRFLGWPESIQQRILQAVRQFHGGRPMEESRTLEIDLTDASRLELLCCPVHSQSPDSILILSRDVTPRWRLQQKVSALDAAGSELVKLESEAIGKLNMEQRLRLLEDKITSYCHQLLHFDNYVVRLLNPKSRRLELILSYGLPTEATSLDLYALPEGNGISGWVASTGQSYVCPEVLKDPRYVVGLRNARSSLTVPLRLHDQIIGIFNVESQQPRAFGDEDRQFAEIFGRYVAMAINILNLLTVERFAATGQLVNDVTCEVSGPLNDISSDVAVLMDEYIGNDDMRKRLSAILENVARIRQCLRDVTDGSRGVLGSGSVVRCIDPVLEGKRVLVADDEVNIRQTISAVLTRYGCSVETAQDGAEAAALLHAGAPFDLVLSDIKMPHKNGYELFSLTLELQPPPPMILMTGFGYDPNHSVVRASQEGLSAVLFKPFKVDQLIGEIRKALESRAV